MKNLKNDYSIITLNEFIDIVTNVIIEYDIDVNNVNDCEMMLNTIKSINKLIQFDFQHKLTIISNNECAYLFIYKIDNKYCYYAFDFECCFENYNCCFCDDVDEFISQCKFDNINDLYDDIFDNTFLFDEINKNDFIENIY